MKPLNKLEKEMAEAINKAGVDYWVNGNQKEAENTLMARAAAKVAVDLAKRAASYGYHVHLDETRGIRSNGYFARFLKSEGIETEK